MISTRTSSEMQYPVSVLVAAISLRKRELVSLLYLCCFLSCGCRCSVSLYCGAVGWSVIVGFPGRAHLICSEEKYCSK